MKNIISIALLLLLSAASCKKEVQPPALQSMTVVKDCTGSYLRLNGKDYQACNEERLATLANGTLVKAAFTRLKDCKMDGIYCEMYHPNEGYVQVDWIE